ncbi:MAG: bifunctional glutamate N-acetyltransferase/amino-acid acetyltransferase ArgJ [Firmicutes bacterium]|nr:bifunctional glutamate N-acetyltransferase/amino-acid acetyltransferase ArgJ [Bacillota bacterium]
MQKTQMQKTIKSIAGGVTAPRGFSAAGVAAGIKTGAKDVALLASDRPADAAGVFTANLVKAFPVLVSMRHLADGSAQAVVVNSGNANACNGPRGETDALAMTAETARLLGMSAEQVLVASTGVIGQPMPIDRVLEGIRRAAAELRPGGGAEAAAAIMTTDTILKEAAVTFELDGCPVTLGGMAKGSGMIHPNMATMLAFVTTDAAIAPAMLRQALRQAADRTFNMITVDGDTSTNDCILALANGAAGHPPIEAAGPAYADFCAALEEVCRTLAVAVARDGEGATKLLEVRVLGAATDADAALAAKAVAGSSLVKAAVFGADANWGRVLCAAGYSGAIFDPGTVDIYLGGIKVAENGGALPFDEQAAALTLEQKEVLFTIDFKQGSGQATAWGCDLTYDYVRINGSYRT